MNYKATRVLVFAVLFAQFLCFPIFAADLLRVTFLDVGQGDAIVLRTAEKTILIDAGDDRFDVAKRVIIPFCKKEGIKKFDHVIMSHPHRDHFGGFIDLVDAVGMDEFIFSTDTLGSGDPEEGGQDFQLYMRLYNALKEKGVKYTQARMTDTWDFGKGIKVDLLHVSEQKRGPMDGPPRLAVPEPILAGEPLKTSANEDSLIFRVTAGKISYLFTGDAEKDAESFAVKNHGDKLKCTILKSGHHGSKTSSGFPLMELAKPEYAVISVGEKNSFKHPSPETIDRYAYYKMKVFRTDKDGTVDSFTDGKTVRFVSKQSPLEFSAKPKVIAATAGSVTLKWTTNKPADTRVKYGVGGLSQEKVIEHAVTDHMVTISGLKPGSTYSYQAISVDERQTDQVVTYDGEFSTPNGDTATSRIKTMAINYKEVYMNKPFEVTVKALNPGTAAVSGLSLELYHTAMAPEMLIGSVKSLSLNAGQEGGHSFPVALNWLGKVELVAVLKKGTEILDTGSLNIELLPKLMVVDCSHGNKDYYMGKFAGMKVDIGKYLGFEMRSASKGIDALALRNAFILAIPHPETEFTADELAVIKTFVNKGGAVMMFGRSDYGNKSNPLMQNKVLEAAGSQIRFNDDGFCDPTNNIGPPWKVMMEVFPSPIIKDVKKILVQTACTLMKKGGVGLPASKYVHLFATGDNDSYNIDNDNLGDAFFYASQTTLLPIPVVAGEEIGLGRVACFGEGLYDDRLYAPSNSIQIPQFNRSVIGWLEQAKDKTLKEILQYVETIPSLDDPELSAMRFEAMKELVMETVGVALENGQQEDVLDTFREFNGDAVNKLKEEVRSTLQFRSLHGEKRPNSEAFLERF
jgi:competence protein ComEC